MIEIILDGEEEVYSFPKGTKLVIDSNKTAKNIIRCGKTEQCFVALEEMGELTQAVSKANRTIGVCSGSDSIRDNLYEELADTFISLVTLVQAFELDVDWLQTIIERKQGRQYNRLGE